MLVQLLLLVGTETEAATAVATVPAGTQTGVASIFSRACGAPVFARLRRAPATHKGSHSEGLRAAMGGLAVEK